MPEYTLSLLFWIAPVCFMLAFLHAKKLMSPVVKKALWINLTFLSAIGFLLDLFFAKIFFTFPDPSQTLGIDIRGIPIEEFVFYLFGFWFIILFYLFNDEYFLRKYNVDESRYARFAGRLQKKIYLFFGPRHLLLLAGWCLGLVLAKSLLNPGEILPGYAIFLTMAAYVPFFLFWRLTRRFLNLPALVFTIVVTTLISIIWEVTLALPYGYWNYNHAWMTGIFLPAWSQLPLEAVTVWGFSSLIVLSYEFTKLHLHRKKL